MSSQSDAATLKKKTMPLLRAVLTAKAKVGIPLHTLCQEFNETCMEPLKFREMGYGSLEQFLRDCSDICAVVRAPEGYLVAKGIASKEDAHIFKLVSGQRKDKKKKSKKFVSLQVRRRASHFTAGKRPNFRPSTKNYSTYPKPALLRSPTLSSNIPFITTYTNNKQAIPFYHNLRTPPTKNKAEIAPRFLKLQQSRNNPPNKIFVSNVQNQVNNNAAYFQRTITNASTVTVIPLPPTSVFGVTPLPSTSVFGVTPLPSTSGFGNNVVANGKPSTPLTTSDIASLEKKMKELLLKKPKGLWATRLRPEFRTTYKEDLPGDIRQIIQNNFLSFIKIESPMPNREILYLKDTPKIIEEVPTEQTNGTNATQKKDHEPPHRTEQNGITKSSETLQAKNNSNGITKSSEKLQAKNNSNGVTNSSETLQAKTNSNGVTKSSETLQAKHNSNGMTNSPETLQTKNNFHNSSSSVTNDNLSIYDPLPDVICITPLSPNNISPTSTSSISPPSDYLPSSKNINKKKLPSPTKPAESKIGSPELPEVGDEIKVFVCHVESLDRFFVQYADSRIEDLVNEMQEYYETPDNAEDIGKPKFGEFCCARYSKDKLWFRSKILSVKEQKNILNESYRCRVIYVDYGNDEYVISSELKLLTDEFCKLPTQAIQCCLHNIYPREGSPNWTEKVIENFKQSVDCVELIMSVKEKNGSVLSIDLTDANGQSVCAYLCTTKCAKRSPTSVPPYAEGSNETNANALDASTKISQHDTRKVVLPHTSNGRDGPAHIPNGRDGPVHLSNGRDVPVPMTNGRDVPLLTSKSRNADIKAKYVKVPPAQDYIDIQVTCIKSTTDISVVMIGPEYDEKVEKLEETMQRYFEDDTKPHAGNLKVGNYYAAIDDDDWYRVEFLGMQDSECEVFILDHGNKTIVARDEIKDLPIQFLELPFQAIQCSLANVPESFDAEILQYLTETTHEKPLIGYIVERPSTPETKMLIELYDSSNEADDININNEVKAKIEIENYVLPRLPDVDGGSCECYIAHVSPTGDVYIQILGPGTERLEILMKDMTGHFTQTRASEIVQRPEVGNICCAKFYDDGAWYRAKVTKVMQQERKVEVEFIDYGNREVIQMLFIRNPDAVNKRVVSLPPQAVKCAIYGYEELDINEETLKKMKEFTQSLEVVYVSVVDDNGPIPLIKILVPTEEENESVDIIDRFQQLLELENQSIEDARKQLNSSDDNDVFEEDSRTTDNSTFHSIANGHDNNTAFEEISIVGTESFVKIENPLNSLKNKDSNLILQEYDVITNSGGESDTSQNGIDNSSIESIKSEISRLRTRSESPAVTFSSAWGIPQLEITDRIVEGVVQDATDPYKFSVVPAALWEELEKLHVNMMKYYQNSAADDIPYKVNDVCVVFHQNHEIYYRAIILAVTEDQVAVKYPDFSGTLEIESTRNIRHLHADFRSLPFLAVRCTLAGVEPLNPADGWDSNTCSIFHNMVMNETFQVEITRDISKTDLTKPLQVRLHGASPTGQKFVINDKLVKLGLAKSTR